MWEAKETKTDKPDNTHINNSIWAAKNTDRPRCTNQTTFTLTYVWEAKETKTDKPDNIHIDIYVGSQRDKDG